MSRPNYYLLLELDPSVYDDWAKIEPEFKHKKNDWSQKSITHPTKKTEFKHLLTLVPDIERVLKAPASRTQEADEAKAARKKQEKEAVAELDKVIQVTAAKGYLTDDDVKQLAKISAGRWTEQSVRNRAGKLKVPIQATVKKSTIASRPRIDMVLNDEIRKNLTLLGKTDLYHYLGAPRSAGNKTLQELAGKEYQDTRNNANKTPEVTARGELVGHCLKLFTTDAEREKYDNSLAWNELEEIRKLAEAAGAGEAKIHARVMADLIARGRKEGLAEGDVVDVVGEVASKRKWAVEVLSGGSGITFEKCGVCGELVPAGTAICTDCGAPLTILCPKCKTPNSTSNRACARAGCGFAIGDMPLANRAVRSAQLLLSVDPAAAKGWLAEALGYWPDHPEAIRLTDALQKKEQELKVLETAIESARAAGRYRQAQDLVEELGRKSPEHQKLTTYRKEVAARLMAALAAVNKARTLERAGRTDDAIDAYRDALRQAADCQEAQDGLRQCPPDPPLGLSATADLRAVILTWSPSPSRGAISYRVIRKLGAQPLRLDDGAVVGTPSLSPFTDSHAEPGTPLYYAVFAEREGISSRRPAVTGPVVRLAQVSNLRVKPGDGKAELEWQPPANARGIEVWRLAKAEPKRGEGTRVLGTSVKSVVDTGLTNGTLYGYRVVAAFDGPSGHTVYSPGVICLVTPMPPPKPVTDLTCTRQGETFEAAWTAPPEGDVRVYTLHTSLLYRLNDIIPASEADDLGTRVPAVGPASVRGTLGGRTQLHLLPVTIRGASAVIGQIQSLSFIDDVQDVRMWAVAGTLYGQWTYPKGFDLVVVMFRTDHFPSGPEDQSAKPMWWTRQQAELSRFHCPVPETDRVYATVYTVAERGGQREYAPGVRREVAVAGFRRAKFQVQAVRKFWFWKTAEWVLTIRPEEKTYLPEMVLVARADGYPLSPKNGTVVLCIDPDFAAPDDPLVVKFRPLSRFIPARTRLFPSDDANIEWLELLPDV